MPRLRVRVARLLGALYCLACCLAVIASVGCERKERVVDVKTPAGDVQVDRNIDNGNVDVNVNRK